MEQPFLRRPIERLYRKLLLLRSRAASASSAEAPRGEEALLASKNKPALAGEAVSRRAAIAAHEAVPGVQLPDEPEPPFPVVISADTECRKPLVASFQHLVRGSADENVGEMMGSETLAGADGGGEDLASSFGEILSRHLSRAEVAAAAAPRVAFAEMREQKDPPADRRLGVAQDLAQPGLGALLLVG